MTIGEHCFGDGAIEDEWSEGKEGPWKKADNFDRDIAIGLNEEVTAVLTEGDGLGAVGHCAITAHPPQEHWCCCGIGDIEDKHIGILIPVKLKVMIG